jgi:hypothetical protein
LGCFFPTDQFLYTYILANNGSGTTFWTFFFLVSDPLCLPSCLALHFFRLFFLGPPPF